MSFEHATQTEYQFVTQNEYEKYQATIINDEATIAEIERNLNNPSFYQGDKADVEKSLAFFKERRDDAVRKISTQTLGIIGIDVAA